MGKTSIFWEIYRKIYGSSIPTPEKVKNARLMEEMLEDTYNIALQDGKNKNFRLKFFTKLVKQKYNIPGAVQDWLIDSIKIAYETGYKEGKR